MSSCSTLPTKQWSTWNVAREDRSNRLQLPTVPLTATIRTFYSNKDPERRIIHLEYWAEVNPNKGETYMRFISRAANLEQELIQNQLATGLRQRHAFRIDDALLLRVERNKYNKNNELTKEPRKHHGCSAHAIEQYVMTRWPNLIMCNVVLIGSESNLVKHISPP
jgi:hypothetical protein